MWIILSLIVAFLFSITFTIDKIYMSKWIKNPIIPILFSGTISILVGGIIFAVRGFSNISLINLILVLVAGGFLFGMNFFYFKAVKLEEISRVTPLFCLAPLFVLILAAIFLGEKFGFLKYVGIFLLIIGAIMISTRSIKIKLNKAFWFMILSTFLASTSHVIVKYLLNFEDYWTIFSYSRVGYFLFLIPFFFVYIPKLIETVKKYGKKVVAVLSINQTIAVAGFFIMMVALSFGSVTLVNSLVLIDVFFVLILSIILSKFFPKTLKEKVTKPIIIQKVVASILMVGGAILVTL